MTERDRIFSQKKQQIYVSNIYVKMYRNRKKKREVGKDTSKKKIELERYRYGSFEKTPGPNQCVYERERERASNYW